jgi:hypothetical protein
MIFGENVLLFRTDAEIYKTHGTRARAHTPSRRMNESVKHYLKIKYFAYIRFAKVVYFEMKHHSGPLVPKAHTGQG